MKSMIIGDHEDQSRNSILEVDPQEQEVGPGGRSYECIFCKRGFPTAQALGGHMNIHRKDRAKNRPNYLRNNNSNKEEDHSFYSGPRYYPPVFASYPQTYTSAIPNDQEGNVRYDTYFSSTSSTSQPINHENNHQDVHGEIRSPSEEEKMMSLRLQYGRSHGEEKKSKRTSRGGNKEDELDLELRLGHDP